MLVEVKGLWDCSDFCVHPVVSRNGWFQTELAEFSDKLPPSPQFRGSRTLQNPTELGDFGDAKDSNEVRPTYVYTVVGAFFEVADYGLRHLTT